MKGNSEVIAWWSAGITSAVACKLAIETYQNVRLIYIDTGSAHEDNARFKSECEAWYGQEIETVKNATYKNVSDVIRKTRYINGPDGARCTLELKKKVRWSIEETYGNLLNPVTLSAQVFGFEYEKSQVNRAIRFLQQYPRANAKMLLIEKGLSKNNCAGKLISAGIKLPVAYQYYNNNNCEGCVKGGQGYWNMVRVVTPHVFAERAADERHIGHSCINGVFLDELDPQAGRHEPMVLPNCGTFCEVELADIPAKSLEDVMAGHLTIYEAAMAA